MRQRCRIRPGCDRGCQRLRREPGGWSKTPPPGGAARRSHRSGLHQDRAPPHTRPPGNPGGPRAGRGVRRSWRFAVKRSSTWKAHPNRERRPPCPPRPGRRDGGSAPGSRPRMSQRPSPRRRKADRGPTAHRESSSPIGCSCRKLVAEVGETHLSRRRAGPPARHGIARGDPCPLDGGRPGSQRATGCGARQRT
jgi:hypothetical protein